MKAWHVIVLIIGFATSFAIGYHVRGSGAENASVRSDTIIVVDTIIARTPAPARDTLIRYEKLAGDTIIRNDTIYVPVVQKEYVTDNYHAWISGYKPSIDSIVVYPKTTYITKKVPARRWGLGVTGGYGIGRSGLSPYIGVGVYYRIW